MARCLISLGANLGDPRSSMQQALHWLGTIFGTDNVRPSRWYRTPPVGGPGGQQEFINAIAAIETDQSPWQVWEAIRLIEHRMGRRRNQRWEARAIDLDVLLYDDVRIWTPHFKIPHPRLAMRRFVLEPACDVAADWIEPVTGWTIAALSEHLASQTPSVLLVANESQEAESISEATRSEIAAFRSVWEGATTAKMVSQIKDQPWIVAAGFDALSHTFAEIRIADAASVASPDPGLPHLAKHDLSSSWERWDESGPRVVMLLAPAATSPDIAWEDWLRVWAERMGFRAEKKDCWPLTGPRYLLPLDDRQWASHEVVAALSAMQCPCDPI